MLPDISAAEITELAMVMSLKYGFLGIPHGGAKAGILCDEAAPKGHKLNLLKAFAFKIRDELGWSVYRPHPDMNTNNLEIREMLRAVGAGVPRRYLVTGKSALYTSLTVIASVKVASLYQDLDPSKSTAAVEGFGKVGGHVAQGLQDLGFRVVAVSTARGGLYSSDGLDINRLRKMSRTFGSEVVNHYEGAERIDRERLSELNVDVLSPCARGHSIDMRNASSVRARVICSGANIPVTDDAEESLFKRGVLCVPDFVSNSGGVLGGTMEFAGIGHADILDLIQHDFSQQVSILIGRSRDESVCPRRLAEETARARFTLTKESAESQSVRNKTFQFGLELYRNGVIPKICVKVLAKRYFSRRIAGKI
jgi:glutamate dehydrogenase/leucine dehydrogenase